jgi:hypothetical protein
LRQVFVGQTPGHEIAYESADRRLVSNYQVPEALGVALKHAPNDVLVVMFTGLGALLGHVDGFIPARGQIVAAKVRGPKRPAKTSERE